MAGNQYLHEWLAVYFDGSLAERGDFYEHAHDGEGIGLVQYWFGVGGIDRALGRFICADGMSR
jgi:hypothetical protein